MNWRRALFSGLLATLAIFVFVRAYSGTDPLPSDRASLLTARAMLSADASAVQLRAPGYPLILTATGQLDSGFAEGIACSVKASDSCVFGPALRVLVIFQIALAMATLGIAYALAWELSRSAEVSAVVLLLVFVCGRYDDAAAGLFAHTWYGFGAMASLYLVASAVTRGGVFRALGAGLSVAATSLFEPTFLMVAPSAMVALAMRRSPALSAYLLSGCVAALAGLLTVANEMHYEVDAIWRHMAWHLAERVAFNQLDISSWWCGLLLPIPIVGGLASGIFPESIVASFGYYVPGTYVYDGANRIFPAVLSQPGAPTNQLAWIVKNHIAGEPMAFFAASFPLFLRGLLASTGIIGLVGLLHTPRMMRWLQIESTRSATMALLLCTAALLLANTFLTPNPVGINPPLTFVLSYAIAYVAAGL